MSHLAILIFHLVTVKYSLVACCKLSFKEMKRNGICADLVSKVGRWIWFSLIDKSDLSLFVHELFTDEEIAVFVFLLK